MIESVAVRQRGAYDFESHYDDQCALQASCPLPAVKAHLADGVLDINGDRIRSTDWIPVLNTVKINKSLNFVAVRSYFQQPVDEHGQLPDKQALIWKKKTPAIRSKEITYRLCKSLKDCLSVTPTLACLELQGLPLRERDLTCLSKGLAKNSTLHHLSLEYCRIGDAGLEIICKGIKNSTRITSVNFSGCSLTWKGAETLAKIIKHYAMKRHNEAWRDSLRYRQPDLDQMSGIRRITANLNPMLSDQGAYALAEALKDDLWLKALDLQQCGISTAGAKSLVDVLKYNTTIVVLDVRQNPLIDRDVQHSIMEQVMINSNGQDTEYKWIKAEPPEDPSKAKPVREKKKRTKQLNNTIGKKTTIKVSSSGRRRTKSTGSVIMRTRPGLSPEVVRPGPGFVPWRTAMRAGRYRGYPPEHASNMSTTFEKSENSESNSPGTTQHSIYYTTEEEASPGGTSRKFRNTSQDHSHSDFLGYKDMKVELEQLRRHLNEETQARSMAEQRVLELTVENNRLRQEMADIHSRTGGILDDDKVLESIEASFQQFHSFLDLLRDAGLGQLISMAGIDQDSMPFGRMDGNSSYANRSMRRDLSFVADRDISALARDASFAVANKDINAFESQRKMNGHMFNGMNEQSRKNGKSRYDSVQQGHYLGNQRSQSRDIDLDRSGQGRKPQVIPQNYLSGQDPTMGGDYDDSFDSVQAAKSEADELYQKVLRDTKGALRSNKALRGDTGADDVSFLIQQQQDLEARTNADVMQKERTPDPVREVVDSERGVAYDDTSLHSQTSNSQHRSGSHRHHDPNSEASSHHASRGSSSRTSHKSHSLPSVRQADIPVQKTNGSKRPPKEPELVSSDNFMKSQMSVQTTSTQQQDTLDRSGEASSPERSVDVAASNSIAHSVASVQYSDSFEGSEDTGSPRLQSPQAGGVLGESEEDF